MRINIVMEQIGSNSPVWDQALEVLQKLSCGTMSDDETDVERSTRTRKVVRRIESTWASAALKSLFRTLDLYYTRYKLDGTEKPGNQFTFISINVC